MKNYATKVAEPCAFITTRKQRIKQNGENVFLKNEQEFELELYNPLSSTVLAKVKLNGNYISSNGLVLKPGQRIYLERYLDDARKFKFETYEVSGNSDEIKQAIINNGSVEVEFYSEYVPIQTINYCYPTTYTYSYPLYYTSPSWTLQGGNIITTNINSTLGGTVSCYNSSVTSSSVTMDGLNTSYNSSPNTFKTKEQVLRSINPIKKLVETGTIEKGSHSEQSFTYVDKTFNNFYSYKSSWKILPFSQKNVESEDLKVYCVGCGRKRSKDSDNFCGSCGSRFN